MPLTPDGFQSGVAEWAASRDVCCAPPVCFDPCVVSCRMVWALPSGPMWDNQKAAATERLRSNNPPPFDLCSPIGTCEPASCGGLVDYAIFLTQFLSTVVDTSIWAAHRESSPFTARDTVADWQRRLGWQDCNRNMCSSYWPKTETGFLAEGRADGVPLYCPPVLPSELECALQSGIVKALARMRLGFIPNLESVSWILEPLGVVMRVYDSGVDAFGDPCISQDCCNPQFMLCPTDGLIEACSSGSCSDNSVPSRIPACVDRSCTKTIGQSDILWPALPYAECIVRSIFPGYPAEFLVLCDEPAWDSCAQVAAARPFVPDPAFRECVGPTVRPPSTDLCGLPS